MSAVIDQTNVVTEIDQETQVAYKGLPTTVKHSQIIEPKKPKNVRTIAGSDEALDELGESISQIGQLQNIVLVPHGNPSHKKYEVIAGRRRYRSIARRIARGLLPDDFEWNALVMDKADATMISLSENMHREGMHPLDEAAAFGKAVYVEKRSIADVAQRAGVSETVVKKRLALLAVSPKLTQLFQENNPHMTLHHMQALSQQPDHAAQEAAWDALMQGWGNKGSAELRDLLNDAKTPATSRLGRFVGLDAYKEAGGETEQDLFSESVFLLNPALLTKLAEAKLDECAEAVRAEGWSVVAVNINNAVELYKIERTYSYTHRDLTDDEQAEKAKLQAQADHISGQMEALQDSESDADEELYFMLEAQVERIAGQIRAIADTRVWTPEQLAQYGAFVTVSEHGQMKVERGLRIRAEGEAESIEGDEVTPIRNFAAVVDRAPRTARPVHSESLMSRLTATHTAAIRAELLDAPNVALAMVAAKLAQRAMSSGYIDSVVGLRLSTHDHGAANYDQKHLRETKNLAVVAFDERASQWAEVIPKEGIFEWVLTLSAEEVASLIAFGVAAAYNGVQVRESASMTNDGVATALDLDMNKWMTVDVDSYFGSVNKERISAVLAEVGNTEGEKASNGMKKGDAAAFATTAIAGTGWLPAFLRTKPAASATEIVESAAAGSDADLIQASDN